MLVLYFLYKYIFTCIYIYLFLGPMKVGFLTIRNCLLSCHSVYISSSFFFLLPEFTKSFSVLPAYYAVI